MKTKRIYVEAKKSKNFQTYTVGLDVEIDENEELNTCVRKTQTKARKLCQEQINIDVGVKNE